MWHAESLPLLDWCGGPEGDMQVEMGYQEGWTYLLILESNNVSFCEIQIELTHRIIPEQFIVIQFFKELSYYYLLHTYLLHSAESFFRS